MFSREFTFRLFKNYAHICSWMHVQGRQLKETVLWDNITYGLKWENKKFKLKRSIRKGWWDNGAKGWRCMVTLKLFSLSTIEALPPPFGRDQVSKFHQHGRLETKGLFTWRWGPPLGEVTCGGSPHLSCKRDQIKMRDYVDRRVTHQSGLPHLPGVLQLHVNRP